MTKEKAIICKCGNNYFDFFEDDDGNEIMYCKKCGLEFEGN